MSLKKGKNHNMRNIIDESVIIRRMMFLWFRTRLALPDPPPSVVETSKVNTPFPSDTPTTSTPLLGQILHMCGQSMGTFPCVLHLLAPQEIQPPESAFCVQFNEQSGAV